MDVWLHDHGSHSAGTVMLAGFVAQSSIRRPIAELMLDHSSTEAVHIMRLGA